MKLTRQMNSPPAAKNRILAFNERRIRPSRTLTAFSAKGQSILRRLVGGFGPVKLPKEAREGVVSAGCWKCGACAVLLALKQI